MKRASDAECRQEIISKLVAIAEKKLSKKKTALFAEFVKQYYSHVALEDLYSRSIIDLYGAVISHWNFMYERKKHEVKLRIFNPTFEEDGWESRHTVIQLVHDDMPFLVDSVTMELNRLGYTIYLIIHVGGIIVHRNNKHQLNKIFPVDYSSDIISGKINTVSLKEEEELQSGIAEAPIYIEINRVTDPAVITNIEKNIIRILKDVRVAIDDWDKMRGKVYEIVDELESCRHVLPNISELDETKEFLRWMVNDHFTFLGCRDYKLIGQDEEMALKIVPGSSAGVLRNEKSSKQIRKFSEMPEIIRDLALSNQILIIAKSNTLATVHRRVYTELISIKRFDSEGNTIGERRFVGLFTSTAYSSRPKDIPFIRDKVRQVMLRSHLSLRGHSGKALLHILETYPRDDLFQASVQEIYDTCIEIMHMQERPQIRLFARRDIYNRFMSCMVYVPRELYNTELRQQMQAVLAEAFQSAEVTTTTQFSESILARIHFMLHLDQTKVIDYDLKAIEKRLIEIGRSWKHDLHDNLCEYYGDEQGNRLAAKYYDAFPVGYRETFIAALAINDIRHLEKLSEDNTLEMSLYVPSDSPPETVRFKLYHENLTIPLSDVLPVLENMGMRVIGEEPYEIRTKDKRVYWINDFYMTSVKHEILDISVIKSVFQEAFRNIWFGCAENDGFNYLVIGAELSWRETSLLRAYAKYFRQIGFTFSQSYIEETLMSNPSIAAQLVDLFNMYFDPQQIETSEAKVKQLEKSIEESLDSIANLDQDRILRRFYEIIKATVRTNFFQIEKSGRYKPYISFKLDSRNIPELPLPLPLYEIFVYSPKFEAVHLRSAKVARGGIRWSDRREDFRTEILGLMKAQQVKNSVIVPQGAKGGFVPKNLPIDGNREEILAAVIACYRNFIKGMLDITDNLKSGKVIPPKNVVRYDEDDPYLVVAADKGTATFSDIANSIAKEYGFWLGDAFASGGSTGYDHKKMGITARGAWESVKRHFRHLNLDIQANNFTVIGIGDMGGDVFGNGMLLSRHIKLIAAFNHLHIFLDPKPKPDVSYRERRRLFKLSRSTWADYNPKLISRGGGVYRRSAKSIRVSAQVKEVFGLKKDVWVPNDLIREMLKAEIDLLWNGGIGTFVKSSLEANINVGDRTNDSIRVDADELQCRVVGEGGNLGFTQLARVEYELMGGMIYTDFIDNSAGVDCSDHEVNIKILLNEVVRKKELTKKQRNKLLAEMTAEVAELVLSNNYHQTQALEMSMHDPVATINLYNRYIVELEHDGELNRELEFLPTEKDLLERKAVGRGFTRPEISVLLAYSKNILKEKILASDIPDNKGLDWILESAFPKPLRTKYNNYLQKHSLRRDIIATQLSNVVINDMGSSFIHRMKNETGAPESSIVKAYLISQYIFDRDGLWEDVHSLDNKIDSRVQIRMMLLAYRLILRGTRWFLRNRRYKLDILQYQQYFVADVKKLAGMVNKLIIGSERDNVDKIIQIFVEAGVDETIAQRIAVTDVLFPALDIIDAAKKNNLNLAKFAEVYYTLGDMLELSWIRQQVRDFSFEGYWEALARSALRDDIDKQQCLLAVYAMKYKTRTRNTEKRIQEWLESHRSLVDRWFSIVADLRGTSTPSFTMYLVAVRELADLTQVEPMVEVA